MIVHVGDNAREAARILLSNMLAIIERMSGSKEGMTEVNIALSGGNSPVELFDVWVNEFAGRTPWERLRLYWVDERCVPVEDEAGNYRLAKVHLLDRVPISQEHVFRIRGEQEDVEGEAMRYSSMVLSRLPLHGCIPVFDFVLLGMGTDGHTSSVFPGQNALLRTSVPYAVSRHPATGQQRIAMTGEVMIHARHTWFYVIGQDKADILRTLSCPNVRSRYPAAYVWQSAFHVELFTDIDITLSV